MWLGFVQFAFLTGLALFSALAVGLRANWESRAELAVATGILAQAFIIFPILLLGWTHFLYRSSLTAAIAIISAIALGASRAGRPWRQHFASVGKTALSLLRLPLDGLALALRKRSLGFLGLVVCGVSIAWTAWLSYLTPSSSWDGLWYHESIVAFAMQNHGFALADVPQSLSNVNSYPRVCEAMNLWFVVFTDRRLVEAVNSATAPLLILAFYRIARRYTDQVSAMGWASAFFLIPGVILQMRSTYIDTHIASIFLPAILFATRPNLRVRDGWMAAICIALLGGTKGHALGWIPFLAAMVAVRLLLRHAKARPGVVVGTIGGGLLMIVAVVAPTYVRNFTVYHNPFWPMAIDVPALHLHFKGAHRLGDLERPWLPFFRDNYAAHIPGHDFFDTQVHQHGLGMPWVVIPIVLVALPTAIALWLYSLVCRERKYPDVENLLLVTLPMLATLPLSPAAWALRYNVHVAAVLMLVAAWAGGRAGMRWFNEGAIGAAVITGIMLLWWTDPAWCVTYDQAVELARMSPGRRAAYYWKWHTVPAETAAARERELGPGDVVVFTDDYTFPAVLWNERYSNRVVYVPFVNPEDFFRRVSSVNAEWVAATAGTGEYHALRSQTADWEEVGILSTTRPWTAFRLRRP